MKETNKKTMGVIPSCREPAGFWGRSVLPQAVAQFERLYPELDGARRPRQLRQERYKVIHAVKAQSPPSCSYVCYEVEATWASGSCGVDQEVRDTWSSVGKPPEKKMFPTWDKLPMVKTGGPKWNIDQPSCESEQCSPA